MVVEDDAPLRALIARLLREDGYIVTGVGDGQGLQALMFSDTQWPVDLVLLDITLPGEDGLSLCARIREHSSVPVIMVSARGKESDRVTGLNGGADDYLAKPFGRPELLARIRAVLRRTAVAGQISSAPGLAPAWLCFAGWRYHVRRQELFAPSGAEVILTAAEHELLLALLRHPQRSIGRERLLELSRQRVSGATDRSIDVLISRLRSKLGGVRRTNNLIRTVRGVGYMFTAEVEAA